SACVASGAGATCLLPLYDEYLIAYRDRSAALDSARWKRVVSRDPFSAAIVVGGRVVGGWKKRVTKDGIVITLMPFVTMAKSEVTAIADAVRSYGNFLGVEPELCWE